MIQKKGYLIKIEPENLLDDTDDLFFSLSLIRNDLSDLMYLQKLHRQSSDLILKDHNILNISPERGVIAGRDIYLLRLLLSNFYGIMEFLGENQQSILKNEKLNLKISNLSIAQKECWDLFNKISCYREKGTPQTVEGVNKETMQIVALACTARNDITYHYTRTARHIKKGYTLAFCSDKKQEHNQYAYATEIGDVVKNRSYYIDVAMQRYLESRANIDGDLIYKIQKPTLELIADFYAVITLILMDFHDEKSFKTNI